MLTMTNSAAAIPSASGRAASSSKVLFYRLVSPIIVSASAVAAFSTYSCTESLRSYCDVGSITTTPYPSTTFGRSNDYLLRHDGRKSSGVPSSKCLQSTKGSNNYEEGEETTTAKPKTTSKSNTLTSTDIQHMKHAAQLARIGYGNTYPNPAVGCVLVSQDATNDSIIIGSGFHPKAGMPHAEVFALFEACGLVEDGVAAARSVMGSQTIHNNDNNNDNGGDDGDDDAEAMKNKVEELLAAYKADGGASNLFQDHFSEKDVTAYVTLEPCCHVGQTPPCALSLVAAGVKRVVVGYRDPNPRVDGGGIQLLKNSGINVKVVSSDRRTSSSKEELQAGKECAKLVEYFVKRISPRKDQSMEEESLEDSITGAQRRALRQITGRKKSDGSMPEIEWPRDKSSFSSSPNNKAAPVDDLDQLHEITMPNRFLESVDNALWDHELVLLRLNNVVKKKKGAKILGERVARELNAHVAQVLGHTALLYRPGLPPVLDLQEIVTGDSGDDSD